MNDAVDHKPHATPADVPATPRKLSAAKLFFFILLLFALILYPFVSPHFRPDSDVAPLALTKAMPHGSNNRAKAAAERVRPLLEPELTSQGLAWGNPVYLRIFKEEAQLELWMEHPGDRRFKLVRLYPVAAFSGSPGPKLQEGDGQAPEGFYWVAPKSMNPDSTYHLSFNIGFPNEYDRFHKRTGSFLMVHGSNVSVGCYAMTDPLIEEIYSLIAAAHQKGQEFVRVHCFPFRMTEERLGRAESDGAPWIDFWYNLHEGYEWFMRERRPPEVQVHNGAYTFLPDSL
jgi:murein L,D-transpeptidase YafK